MPRAHPTTIDAGLGQAPLQVALGLIWLADGALQLQPFMFSRSFVTEIIAPNALGQPGVVAEPVSFGAHQIEPSVAVFNGLAATIQILLGLGLLYRPTVKPALVISFACALGIARKPCRRQCGACHRRRAVGARWLSSLHSSVAAGAAGRGAEIAVVAACLSAAIGLGALLHRWERPLLALSAGIALVYFVVGQGMGGVLTGSGTAPGTGPLLVLLAASVYRFDRSHLKLPAFRRLSLAGPRVDVSLDSGEPSFVAYGTASKRRERRP